jgi:malonate decarboxylase gamma subunit
MGSERIAFLEKSRQERHLMPPLTCTRGRVWFKALTGHTSAMPGDPHSVLTVDAPIGKEKARFLCVVPDPNGRFPCARHGEVGIEEAYTLATRVREVIDADKEGVKRPVIAIVDVKSQAYGRREEMAGIHLAGAAAADAYATARFAGHSVIALIVGQAISGGFLTHGYQANRILAFDDDAVLVHAMHKEAAARITRRTVDELDQLAETVTPLSYRIRDYAKLGLLHKLLQISAPDNPTTEDVEQVHHELIAAIQDARKTSPDLTYRIDSEAARVTRKATRSVRNRLAEQWNQQESAQH